MVAATYMLEVWTGVSEWLLSHLPAVRQPILQKGGNIGIGGGRHRGNHIFSPALLLVDSSLETYGGRKRHLCSKHACQ